MPSPPSERGGFDDMKKALITGITGQDGSYLAELLLEKGYEVHGIIRRSSSFNTQRIDHIYQDPHTPGCRLFLHFGDLNDASSLNLLLKRLRPDEIYNLGAQSHVKVSFVVTTPSSKGSGSAARAGAGPSSPPPSPQPEGSSTAAARSHRYILDPEPARGRA